LAIPKKVLVADALPAIAMVEDLSIAKPSRKVGENIVGTAFAADARGYFLTAKHVVHGLQAQQLQLRTNYSALPENGYAMKAFSVEEIYPHPQLDIAVLAVASALPAGRVKLIELESVEVRVGTDVLLVGYGTGTDLVFCDDILGPQSPKSFSPVAFNGMICARVPDDDRPVDLLVYDCTTFGGNSGAPLLSIESGTIVGLHLRGYEHHIGYAVPINRCLGFVDIVAKVHEPRRQGYRSQRTNRQRKR
jgi:S1-C subfamily serine protease